MSEHPYDNSIFDRTSEIEESGRFHICPCCTADVECDEDPCGLPTVMLCDRCRVQLSAEEAGIVPRRAA